MLKWKLMISTLPIVLVMAGVKLVLDLYFEFPGLVPFADVGVILTACVFLIGFLLAGTMADYKESERLPAEIAATLETIEEIFALAAINRRLMRAERGFLDPAGIPGRPWYRHQIYAPKFTYAPELLPALAEAVEANDEVRLAAAVAQISAAIDRATTALTQ